MKNPITIKTEIKTAIGKTWDYWNQPEHIVKWNSPSPDWHTVSAEVDLQVCGKFLSRMEAKDGSFGFDFEGVYDEIKLQEFLKITLGDGRKMQVEFKEIADGVEVKEIFEPENINPIKMQQQGWQAILDNFKNYTENN
jgi:uncharacterized protein YndB with AHSA1/START domain